MRWIALVVPLALAVSCQKGKVGSAAPPPPRAPEKVAAVALPVAPAGFGDIHGTVSFNGKAPVMAMLKRTSDPYCAKTPMRDQEVVVDNGKLVNVVVRIAKGLTDTAPVKGTMQVEQHECMYVPRVSAVQLGTTVEVKNMDKTLHNVHAYESIHTVFNRAQPPGSKEVEYEPKTSGQLVAIKCDVHPWMHAYLMVNGNPFFAVTGKEGTFHWSHVPAGTYTVEAWQEKYGTRSSEITVRAGQDTEVNFTYGSGSAARVGHPASAPGRAH